MKIVIEHGQRDFFNVGLASADGKDPFLTIKGCKVVTGANGRFVSGPAKPPPEGSGGKWFNFVFMSDDFQAAVLKAYDASKPKTATASHSSDDDIPF